MLSRTVPAALQIHLAIEYIVYQLQKNANKKVIELCYVAVTITSLSVVKLATAPVFGTKRHGSL